MRLLVALDFDGVLFNSAYEAYCVCEEVAKSSPKFRNRIHFDEFMEFRSHLTDAWQFNRLYSLEKKLNNFSALTEIKPDSEDWVFSEKFFASRASLMSSQDWAKTMPPELTHKSWTPNPTKKGQSHVQIQQRVQARSY